MFWFPRLGRLQKYIIHARFPFVHFTFLQFKSTMGLNDFTVAEVYSRRRYRCTRVLLLQSLISTNAASVSLQRSERLRRDFIRVIHRLRHTQAIHFNLNIYREQQRLGTYRFRPIKVFRIAKKIEYVDNRTKRS